MQKSKIIVEVLKSRIIMDCYSEIPLYSHISWKLIAWITYTLFYTQMRKTGFISWTTTAYNLQDKIIISIPTIISSIN